MTPLPLTMHAANMYTKAEEELTSLLVIELLAHQFCSPVQWIDTQDSLFGGDDGAERVIEIGPANTLVNMAKKTLAASYKTQDIARGRRRELLGYHKQADAIYYRSLEPEVVDAPVVTPNTVLATAAKAPAPEVTPAPLTPIISTTQNPSATIPDVPLEVSNILMTIVALGLKKSPEQISAREPLKQLCGGRSTLQNEITGDLSAEFGNLPDQAEDLSLSELAALVINDSPNRSLGPCTTSRLGKFVSAKMPPGSGVSSLRRHLGSKWGLGSSLQDRVLLAALVQQPAGRLTDEAQMQSFLDGIATHCLAAAGIDINAMSVARSANVASTAIVPPEALLAVQKENLAHDERLYEIYARRCNRDPSASSKEAEILKSTVIELQSDLDLWMSEHGEYYGQGIRPKFDSMKSRTYDSCWNWVVQDFLDVAAKLTQPLGQGLISEEELLVEAALLQARVTPRLLKVMDFIIRPVDESPEYENHRKTLVRLRKIVQEAAAKAPIYRASPISMRPVVKVDGHGRVQYSEKERTPNFSVKIKQSLDLKLLTSEVTALGRHYFSARTSSSGSTAITTPMIDDILDDSDSYDHLDIPLPPTSINFDIQPYIKTKGRGGWLRNEPLSKAFLDSLKFVAQDGITFQGKTVLVTGAGKESIAFELVKMMITAGAKVVVTTSSYSTENTTHWEAVYARYGGRGSQLVLLPFNGASQQDTISLVEYVYSTLGWDPDHIIPFAAIGEGGRTIENIDSKSELAHRMMLTNVLRLLGAIKTHKERRRIYSHPTQVILPLSPNHGVFGNDGLYAESKIGLEALLEKYQSEDWGSYLGLCGTIIGWTRGTGLMAANNILAAGIEETESMRTYSTAEMAVHIACLMTGSIVSHSQLEPLLVDISGNMSSHPNLRSLLDRIQADLDMNKEVNAVLNKERLLDEQAEGRSFEDELSPPLILQRRPRVGVDTYRLPDDDTEVSPLRRTLEGLVDLERVAVIAGFGEFGPYGNSRTRWEIETDGHFSVQGCLEMAWLMNLIKYHNGLLKGEHYCGWLETSTGAPIGDSDVKIKYEQHILAHSGIRVYELHDHDPEELVQGLLHEVTVVQDLDPFEVSAKVAEDLRRQHGDKVEISEAEGQMTARLKSGATLMVPKAAKLRNAVGAQIPTGWDPKVYGIEEDIISQVDRVTLYTIIATVEALISAGITDPYELYRHIHVSEVAVCVGSGFGGMTSLRKMFKDRYMDKDVQNDILAETFVNTTGAWVNMLLLGASGPIRTPVGACATGLESVDTGFDLITTGKAKVCLVGGFDAQELDVNIEFSNMQANVDSNKETAAGRDPKHMSRPTASSRAGFVNAEGSGVQLMTTAKLALEMGLPIHAIVSLTHTASDGIGRSIPAPGKGLLTVVAENAVKFPPPMLDISHRRKGLDLRKAQIAEQKECELAYLEQKLKSSEELKDGLLSLDWADAFRAEIELDAARSLKEACNMYGNGFWQGDQRISPLRGSLAVWGLTVDDIGVASLHGTSTVKNDINETGVLQQQLYRLGRSQGNVLPCVCQKWLTGHSKGGAGGFSLNGCLQMLSTGTIPGNRNADNIDSLLEASDLLVFPNRTIRAPTGTIKAFSVTSFGFGQKGAQVIGVHPRYLFAAISQAEFAGYAAKVKARRQKAYRYFQDGFYGNELVQLKKDPPYLEKERTEYLVRKDARTV
ncbi:hypothetical protein BJ170DRAFT_652492 [Xylariales sp. AK1849]|nr:hypothetical protein BJ170DRAFT_652492 [Xylariales sp. AK1849]